MSKFNNTDYNNKFKPQVHVEDSLHDIRDDVVEEVVMVATGETIEIPMVEPNPVIVDGYVDIDEVALLRLRAEPSSDSKILMKLVNGTKLVVLSDDDPDWFFVETTDGPGPVMGFVMRKFVRLSM